MGGICRLFRPRYYMALTVAWISFFPIEWLDDVSEELRNLPKVHPATWQRVLLGELEKCNELKLHVFVLRKHFKKSEQFVRNGVTFHLIKTYGGLRASSFYWLDTVLLRKELAAIEPDLVHAWGTEGGAALVAGRLDYPCLVTCQGLLNWIRQSIPLNAYDRFHALLEDISLGGARTVTTESKFSVGYLRKRYPQLDVHQVEHAPLRLFSELKRAPVREKLRILFVGGLNYLKGGDVMLRSLDSLVDELDFELICVGNVDKPFFEKIRPCLSDAFQRRVHLVGSRTATEIAGELSKATWMLYPTRCDNSPNAVKEAAVAGVPVIASNVGGIIDYIWPGENGLLFEAGSVAGCAKAVRQAASHALFSCGQVNELALRRVRDYLSKERMAWEFMQLYYSVSGNSGHSR